MSGETSNIELHAFSDASKIAFGTAIYIRSISSNGKVVTNLLCARSRVAPMDRPTVPNLELCGAHLMVKLVIKVLKALGTSIKTTFYWTDSTAVLSWIRRSPSDLSTFVANRITFIQEHTKVKHWKYVPSSENPADILTRGATPKDLTVTTIWFHGPKFLESSKGEWPKFPVKHLEIDEEAENVALITLQPGSPIIREVNHRNSFKFLQRTIAYIMRFKQNLRSKTTPARGQLTSSELQDATMFIIKEVQQIAFKDEIRHLSKHALLPPEHSLCSFKLFVDGKGLLRVGGRIELSNAPYEAKHQLLLPHSNEIVRLLLQHIHEKNLHAGPQALLRIVQQEFWPIGGKTLSQSIVLQCIRCARAKPRLYSQIMGNLPKERVSAARPFSNVGIDFCGPVQIHYNIRGKRPTKAYIAAFVCFCTKAVHLELVSNLTKDAFIGALKRFIARRGRPMKIYCDSATNFVGAKNELKEVQELFFNKQYQNDLHRYCADERIDWLFIPPRSPHFGGLWEAAVKSAKYHLKRVIAGASLTYEELHTVIAEIEAVLNSRPLTPLSNNPNDLQAITPGHFLIGEPLNAMPNPSHNEVKLLQRWKQIQTCQTEFWERWSKEYLQTLQIRNKWKTSTANVSVGKLVLLKEDNLPPLKWAMGRIIRLHEGSDGLTRVVDVKTEKGIFRRAVHNLSPLPVDDTTEIIDTERPDDSKRNTTNGETSANRVSETLLSEDLTKTSPHSKESKASSIADTSPVVASALIASRNHNSPALTTRNKTAKKKNKHLIHPINSNWLSSPALNFRCSDLQKFHANKKPQSTSTSPTKETRSVNSKRSQSPPNLRVSKIAKLAITLLVLFVPSIKGTTQTAIDQVVITPFTEEVPIYFEDVGKVSMVMDSWNIIAFFNMTEYWKDMHNLRNNQKRLKEICTQTAKDNQGRCNLLLSQFQTQLNTIQTNNNLLVDGRSESRKKRSPFDFIGTMSNKLFGILDQGYAEEMSSTIEKINVNEHHIINLIKNQTSVVDSTLNLLQKDRSFINEQMQSIESYLERLRLDINTTSHILEDQGLVQAFNTLSIHFTLLLMAYQRVQTTLMDVTIDSHNGKMNPLILRPDQLENELRFIREHIPASLTVPNQYGNHRS